MRPETPECGATPRRTHPAEYRSLQPSTTGGGIVDAGDDGELVGETDDDGRPGDCECGEFHTDADLPCWPCYRDGFEEPNAGVGEGTDDGRQEPTRSEPADFGGGESTGVQDL